MQVCNEPVLRNTGSSPDARAKCNPDRRSAGTVTPRNRCHDKHRAANFNSLLTAPYDEENTGEFFLVERCESETIFELWERNSNADLHDGRNFERMTFRSPISDE